MDSQVSKSMFLSSASSKYCSSRSASLSLSLIQIISSNKLFQLYTVYRRTDLFHKATISNKHGAHAIAVLY